MFVKNSVILGYPFKIMGYFWVTFGLEPGVALEKLWNNFRVSKGSLKMSTLNNGKY